MSLRKLNAVCNTGGGGGRGGSSVLRGVLGEIGNGARHHASPPYLQKKEINENVYTRKRDTEVKTCMCGNTIYELGEAPS